MHFGSNIINTHAFTQSSIQHNVHYTQFLRNSDLEITNKIFSVLLPSTTIKMLLAIVVSVTNRIVIDLGENETEIRIKS